jgi:hypothetical protein
MGLRFWKRVQILPGVTLNLSRGMPSVSIGPRGAKLTIGGSGARATVGLPGTGLFYTEKLDKKKPKEPRAKQIEPGAKRIEVAPDTLVGVLDAACDLIEAGKDAEALARLEARPAKLRHRTSFLSGLLYLRSETHRRRRASSAWPQRRRTWGRSSWRPASTSICSCRSPRIAWS